MNEEFDLSDFEYKDAFDEFDEMIRRNEEERAKYLKRMDAFEQFEQMIRAERLNRILARLHRINGFDIYKYWPNELRAEEKRELRVPDVLRAKSRQKSMLVNILSDLYNYEAFGFLDVYTRKAMGRRRITFLSLRAYYRKYTGGQEGPRYWAMKERQRKLQEAINAKNIATNDIRSRLLGGRTLDGERATSNGTGTQWDIEDDEFWN